MATKTWNGASAPLGTAADWSDGVPPGPGDIGIITSGTVTATGTLAAALTLRLTSSRLTGPTLVLTDAVIAPGDVIEVSSSVTDSTLRLAGQVVNRGSIQLNGTSPILGLGAGGVLSTLTNYGAIVVNGAATTFVPYGSAELANNGIIAFRAPASGQTSTVFQTVSGTGSLRLTGPASLTLAAPVSAGQTVVFEAGPSSLQINTLDNFKGTLQAFNSADTLVAYGSRWDTYAFTKTAAGGVLAFKSGANVIETLNLLGNYASAADFSISQTAGNSAFTRTDISTTVAAAPTAVLFTDTTTGLSATDPGTAYSGPVSYLQSQFIWDSSDGVAMAATASNMFLHGGAGADAISASGGSNVLDGGGGSNFLVGASGADGGTDTFFLDERGGDVTWSTLLNFHQGDALTIFGFVAGKSTLPFVDNDGATGFTGATIHSEINGNGTGVNGSVTFVGYSVADVQNKFSITPGTIGDTNYLYVFNHG